MANTPKARHSKTKRNPVTIDLDPESVSRTPREADETSTVGRAEDAAGERAAPQPAEEAVSEPRPDTKGDEGSRQEEAVAETTAAADAATTPPRRTGRALLAGIAGGIVALLLAGGLQWAGVLPVPQSGGDDPSVAALRQDIGDIESRLAGMEDGAGGGASAADLSALAERVGALDSSLQALQEEVAGLKEAPQPAGADASAIAERLSRIEQQVQGAAQSAGTLGDLSQRIARLEQGAAAAEGDAGQATENANRLAALQGRLDALGREVEARGEQPQIARLVAATALKSAVDRGVPFDGELQAYAALAPETSGLAALQAYAARGVPTRAVLAGQVPAVASRIVSAETADGNAGFWQRLWASARSLVVVRPVGEVEGDGVPAIAARFEAHVKAGDYAAALAEYDGLPQEAKAAAAAFADRLRARAAADRIMDEALTGALKAG